VSSKILPSEFLLEFHDNNVGIKELPDLILESKISLGDNELYIFFVKDRQVYRIRVYKQSSQYVTGDLRIRMGPSDWFLVAFLTISGNFDLENINMDNIDKYKSYFDETQGVKPENQGNFHSILDFLKDSGAEQYYDKFVEQEVDMEALLLFDQNTLSKYIEKDGPRLKFWKKLQLFRDSQE
jgi:hypothetical protein